MWLLRGVFLAVVMAAVGCGKISSEEGDAGAGGVRAELDAGGQGSGGNSGAGGAIAGTGGTQLSGTGGAAPCTLAPDHQSFSCPGCVSTCQKWCSDDQVNGATSVACRACPANPNIDSAGNFGGKVQSCGPTGASLCCRWDPATLWGYCAGAPVCH